MEALCKSRMTITHQWTRKNWIMQVPNKYAGSWCDHSWYVPLEKNIFCLSMWRPMLAILLGKSPVNRIFFLSNAFPEVSLGVMWKIKWTGAFYKHLMFWFWILDPGFWRLGLGIFLNLESVLWIFLCTSIFPDGTFFSVLWYCLWLRSCGLGSAIPSKR